MDLVRSVRLADCFATNSGRREPDDRPDALHEAGSEFFWPLIPGASATTIAWSTLSFSASKRIGENRCSASSRSIRSPPGSDWLDFSSRSRSSAVAQSGRGSSGRRATKRSMFRGIDTDSQMGSNESIADSLDRVRVDEWRRATGRKPTVIVGLVRNRSSDHIKRGSGLPIELRVSPPFSR